MAGARSSSPLANTVNSEVWYQYDSRGQHLPCRKHHHPKQPAFAGPENELTARLSVSPVGQASRRQVSAALQAEMSIRCARGAVPLIVMVRYGSEKEV